MVAYAQETERALEIGRGVAPDIGDQDSVHISFSACKRSSTRPGLCVPDDDGEPQTSQQAFERRLPVDLLDLDHLVQQVVCDSPSPESFLKAGHIGRQR